MMEDKFGFMIYRVQWEMWHLDNSNEEVFEDFYTDWTLNKEQAFEWKKELQAEQRLGKRIVYVSDVIAEFVTCTQHDLDNIQTKKFPLIEKDNYDYLS